MAVSINLTNLDGELWSKRKRRLETLKAKQYKDLEPKEGNRVNDILANELYESAKEGNADVFINVLEQVSSKKQQSLSTIFEQLTPSGNSLLHVAARYGGKDVTRLVGYQFPHLITKKNSQGDTALHLASRAGEFSTTEVLLDHAKSHGDAGNLVRMKNEHGNTALHDAVIGGHHKVVRQLVSVDHEVTYYMNKEVKSPLYLAVKASDESTMIKASNESMADILLEAIANDSDSLRKLEGKSPVFAAIKQKKIAILEKIAIKMPELMNVGDTKLRSPIHVASWVGFVGGVRFLLEKFSETALMKNQDGLYPIHIAAQMGHVEVLMEFAKKWSYPMEFVNEKKQNILHVAAENGRENVVRYILKTYEHHNDVNEKDVEGNTPLHLAAKKGHSMVVFALVRDKRVNRMVVNNENHTPYSVAEKQSKVVEAEHEKSDGKKKQADLAETEEKKMKKQADLAETEKKETKKQADLAETGKNEMNQPNRKQFNGVDEQVDSMEVMDEKMKSPIEESTCSVGKKKQVDLAETEKNEMNQPSGKLDFYGVMMTSSILFFFAGPRKPLVDYIRIQSKPLPREEMKSRIEALLVVAVLVAGVTFAGAIQLPAIDDSKSDNSTSNSTGNAAAPAPGPNTSQANGTQTIISKQNAILLQVYVYFDMVALNASVMAAIILCWAQLYDIKLASHAVWLASILIGGSIYLMSLAFSFAVAIAVSKHVESFSVIIAVEGAFFLVQTVLSAPLIIPPSANQIIEKILSPAVYFMIFLAYFVFQRLLSKLASPRKKEQRSSP